MEERWGFQVVEGTQEATEHGSGGGSKHAGTPWRGFMKQIRELDRAQEPESRQQGVKGTSRRGWGLGVYPEGGPGCNSHQEDAAPLEVGSQQPQGPRCPGY